MNNMPYSSIYNVITSTYSATVLEGEDRDVTELQR